MLNIERNRALAFMLFIIPAVLAVALAVAVTSVALAQDQGAQQAPPAQDNPQQPPPGQPSQPSQSQGGQPPPQGNVDVDIKVHDEPVWYGQWWVWALGIAVFLVVIVALTNRGGQST